MSGDMNIKVVTAEDNLHKLKTTVITTSYQ